MSPRHFSNMYKNKNSHRHDQISDWDAFDRDIKHLCGMLYSVVTLKAFFPKSPAKIEAGEQGAKKAGDQE